MSRARTGLVSRLLLQRQLRNTRTPSLSSSNVLSPARGAAAAAPAQWRNLASNAVASAGSSVSSSSSSSYSEHTAKWMTKFDNKSPQELIAEVPPIEVGARVVACEGGRDPSLGHPVEYICLDLPEPSVCKYCGLRYVQAHHHH